MLCRSCRAVRGTARKSHDRITMLEEQLAAAMAERERERQKSERAREEVEEERRRVEERLEKELASAQSVSALLAEEKG